MNSAAVALQKIKALNMPAELVQFWECGIPDRLKYQFQLPGSFYFERVAVTAPFAHYVPLLQQNGEAIFAFDEHENVFVEHYFEDEEPTVIGASYQQLCAWLLADLYVAGLPDVADVAASSLGFLHLQALREFMGSEEDMSWEQAKRKFVDSFQPES